MSVNRYTTESGLQTLANGQRCWIGTKAAYEAAVQAGTMENDILVAITDDDDDYKTDTVAENDNRVVTSGGVYNELEPIDISSEITKNVTHASFSAYKIGKTINVKGSITSGTIANSTVVITLPSKYTLAPNQSYMVGGLFGSNQPLMGNVSVTNRTVSLVNATATSMTSISYNFTLILL